MAKKPTVQNEAPAKQSLSQSNLPQGFAAITANADNHNFDDEPTLHGIIRRFDTAKLSDGPRKVCHIEIIDGDHKGERRAVWDSVGLRAIFECAIGDEVYIAFQGFAEPKPGKNPARLYEIGVKHKGGSPM